jgi:hypothetical protein
LDASPNLAVLTGTALFFCRRTGGPENLMRTDDRKSSNILGPLLLTGALALAGVVGAIDLVRAVADLGPRVGDVLAFRTGHSPAINMNARLDVARADQGTCRLDIGVLRLTGGSMVVEQRQPGMPRLYRVHWSGPRTSTDGGNCGVSADLRLRDADMEILALAAGGYGLGRRAPPTVRPPGAQAMLVQ